MVENTRASTENEFVVANSFVCNMRPSFAFFCYESKMKSGTPEKEEEKKDLHSTSTAGTVAFCPALNPADQCTTTRVYVLVTHSQEIAQIRRFALSSESQWHLECEK
jgi:hypothetical protein